MKIIKIKALALENFKCHKSLRIDFGGENTAIYGDNATGKTSIYDGLTWLLFGRDSRGNGEKNTEIKPLDENGAVRDHSAQTSVEAIFECDGRETSFKRTYQEVWTTKRGFSEPVYDGNTSEYFCDGVPLKKYAFQEKVSELVPEDVFKVLTSVNYFAEELSWQERRATLFDAAGKFDDATLMRGREDFSSLLSDMGGLSLDEYKKKLQSRRKGLTGVRDELPCRISECEKTIEDLSDIDFDGARLLVDKLKAEEDSLSAQLISIERGGAADEKNTELKAARVKLDELEFENRKHRSAQEKALPDVAALKAEVTDCEKRIAAAEEVRGKVFDSIEEAEKSIEASRAEWIAKNGESFSGGICPTCRQTLPAAQLSEARSAFEQRKAAELREIEKKADGYKLLRDSTSAQISNYDGLINEEKKKLEKLKASLSDAEAGRASAVICDMEGYADTKESLTAWIGQLEGEVATLRQGDYAASKDIRDKLGELKLKLKDAMETAGKEGMLRYTEKRIESLRAEAQVAAEQLQEIDRQLWICEEFIRYKTSFVEDSVNGLFRIARFRLFREQANGGLEERCDVTYDGIPYQSLNSGARINVGIDIINTLSSYYGVSVPLFIDNAESVTALEKANGQIIRLAVSENDKELRINYES